MVWINCYHLSTSITDATNCKRSENELDPPKNTTISLLLRKKVRNRSVSYVRALLKVNAVGNALDIPCYQELCGFALSYFDYLLMLFLIL